MLMQKWFLCALASLILFGNNTAHSEQTSWQEQKLVDMYSWFNTIADPKTPFHKEDLTPFFTSDFVMQANNEEITHNYEDLYEHFVAFRQSGKTLQVNFPFDEFVIDRDGEKVALRYSITESFLDGYDYEILVMAIWHFSGDGRLKRMNEVFCTK